jgi:hypothetical protein
LFWVTHATTLKLLGSVFYPFDSHEIWEINLQ